jgi:hypothetical protein
MTHSGKATLAHFKFLLFPILFTANTNLGIGVTPPAHPRSLFDPIVFVLVQYSYPEQPIYKSSERATSPAGNWTRHDHLKSQTKYSSDLNENDFSLYLRFCFVRVICYIFMKLIKNKGIVI